MRARLALWTVALFPRRIWGVAAPLVAVLVVAPAAGSAQAGPSAQPGPSAPVASRMTSLIGIVGDSLHGGPLAGATVLVDGQPGEATTDSIGRFRFDSVEPGQHSLGIFHPILDSLGSNLASSRPVKFVAGKPSLVTLATPSGRTIRHAVCPDVVIPKSESGDSGMAVVVGRVLDPETEEPVSGSHVSLTWIETAFNAKGIGIKTHARDAVADKTGEFYFCALPSGLVGNLRAYFESNPQDMVERELDLGVRILTITVLHLPRPDTTSGSKSAQALRTAILAGVVSRPDGSAMSGATAWVQGTADSAVTNDKGAFEIHGLPAGTHMLIIRSLGFEPVSQAVELSNRTPRTVEVALLTPAHVLDPILVEARQLQAGYARVGFDKRQQAGVGTFLTADDIARKGAQDFSQIFATTLGIRLTYAPSGTNVESSHGVGACVVYVLDGMPFNRVVDGELDALYQPGDIGAIEIYEPAAVPAQFQVRTYPTTNEAGVPVNGRMDCTTIVVWTKIHLGITPAN
jgi:hypothetical protein